MADYADSQDINWTATESPVKNQTSIYDELNKGYSEAIANQEKTPQLISRYNDLYGIPTMQANIASGTEQYDYLGNQISNMPNSIAQRSQESILTQGQKDRQVTAESAPLLTEQNKLGQTLARQQTNLNTAQTNASAMVTATQVDQQKELSAWLKQYDTESILSSMRMTGWTFENQSELDKLIANQNAGVTLSEGERDRLNALALEERKFENQLKLQQNSQSWQSGENSKDRLLSLASNY
jgi:hypothetical protein